MTRITLVCLILSSFYCQWVLAQNDGVEWAPIGATWYYSYTYHTSPQVDYIRMEATKDNLVNGKNARLIEGIIFSEDGSGTPASNRYDDGSYIIYQQGRVVGNQYIQK